MTNQSVFIQTKNVPDVRVRQAMLYAIDRKMVLEQLLKGKGEVADGFLSSASPFYDDSIVPVEQDVELSLIHICLRVPPKALFISLISKL